MPRPIKNTPRAAASMIGRGVFTRPPAAKKTKRYAHCGDNAKIILTGAPRAATRETADLFDAAHEAYDGFGMLLPAARTMPDGRAVPTPGLRAARRRYHPSQLVGRPGAEVGIDSAFDAWSRAVAALAAQGVKLSGGWDGGGMIEKVLGAGRGRARDDIRLRDILHQRTRQRGLTADEARLERLASIMLRRSRA